jgi:G:T-mismatch repair DNA endonuclease (very short patch repair protein)
MSKSTKSKTTKPIKTIDTTAEVVQTTALAKQTGAQVREAILIQVKKLKIQYVPVVGNTYPQKKLIWVHGGYWDKEAKVQMVPSIYAEKMQKAVDELDVKIQANIAKRKANQEAVAV